MKTTKTVLITTGFLSAACVLFGAGAKPKHLTPPDEKAPSSSSQTAASKSASPAKGFAGLVVYVDEKAPENHYAPSGWMGDFGGLKMDTAWAGSPHSGKTSVRFSYKPTGTAGAKWIGVFWQDPPNNWGEKDGGYDLSGAERLSFWARGEKGGEIIKEIKVGGIKGNYSDSDEIVAGPITLETTWKQYSINLKGHDLSAISGGFCWSTDTANNPDGLTFYVDDIRFE